MRGEAEFACRWGRCGWTLAAIIADVVFSGAEVELWAIEEGVFGEEEGKNEGTKDRDQESGDALGSTREF